MSDDARIHGLLAEFGAADELLRAVERARAERYSAIEAFSPFPIDGLAEAIAPGTHGGVAPWMLAGAVLGGGGTYLLEWYSAVIDYPILVGGRPLNSWPAFLPPAIEMTVLGAVIFGVLAMLIANGLPRLHHPLFGIAAFERASSDRFFLLVHADDPRYQRERTGAFLAALSPLSLTEVAS